jgi:hypothetical protein
MIAVTASASHTFIDTPDNHTFHRGIEWTRDSGVTRGCNPPASDFLGADDTAADSNQLGGVDADLYR